MIKVIVMAVVGLLLGLGGGSGFAVMKAKKVAAAVSDRVAAAKADSAESKDSHGDDKKRGNEAPTVAVVPDSAAASHPASVKPDSAPAVAHAPAPKPAAKAPPPTVTASVDAKDASTSAASSAPAGRISKIFAAMAAKDAARVLEQMEDADVQTVLFGLNDRQAAAILAGFPPARAAAISRATLRKKGTS